MASNEWDDEPIDAKDITGVGGDWQDSVVLHDDESSPYTKAEIDHSILAGYQSQGKEVLSMGNDISFSLADGTEAIRLCSNGDIMVKGEIAEKDGKLVDAMRDFLQGVKPDYDKENTVFPLRMCFDAERFRARRTNRKGK